MLGSQAQTPSSPFHTQAHKLLSLISLHAWPGPSPSKLTSPHSLADLVLKNHGRLKKPSSTTSTSSKRKKHGVSPPPSPFLRSIITTGYSELDCPARHRRVLIRAIISRAEVDLKKVEEYKVRYGHTVTNDVVGDTPGYYKDILLTLVGLE